MKNRHGMTSVEVVMEFVAPVIGGVLAILVLRHTTSMPMWACCLIGVPVGTIVAWAVIIGAVVICGVILRRSKRTNDSRRELE